MSTTTTWIDDRASEGDVAQARLPMTLVGRLAHHARQTPDRCALRLKHLGIWQAISWADYHAHVAAVAHALATIGLSAGDHLGILSDNCPEWLYADLGAQALGVRAVGIYQTNPPKDVRYILEHCEARLIFCQDQEQVDKVLEIADALEALEHIVVFDERGLRHYDDARLVSFERFVADGARAHRDDPGWIAARTAERHPDEVTMIVYTSGTTGPPKGAQITPRNALSTNDRILAILDARADDTLLSYLPLCHIAEKIFTFFLPLTTGAVVHFGESVYTVQDDLREVQPTVFLGVPRIWEKIHASVTLKMKDSTWLKRTLFEFWMARGMAIAARRRGGRFSLRDRAVYFVGWLMVFRALRDRLGLGNCRRAVTGAAPISAELLHWFHALGVMILEGYGQTECAGVSHLNPSDDIRAGTVGQVVPGVECRIADDGEILVRGDNVFAGYLHNAQATATTIDAQGWLHTGDIGHTDEAGYLTITGRKKEIIITSGGKNLSPEKIENVLKLSPYIKEAVAIGDRRKFISALIQIDAAAVGDWASRRGLTYTSFADLSAKAQTRDLIKAEIARLEDQGLLAQVERVRQFRLFPKELHQDDGEVTATQKVRRRAIQTIYADLIESMY